MIFVQQRPKRASNRNSGEGFRRAPQRAATWCYAGAAGMAVSRFDTRTGC